MGGGAAAANPPVEPAVVEGPTDEITAVLGGGDASQPAAATSAGAPTSMVLSHTLRLPLHVWGVLTSVHM